MDDSRSHEAVAADWLNQVRDATREQIYIRCEDAVDLPPARALLAADDAVKIAAVLLTVEQLAALREVLGEPGEGFNYGYANLRHHRAFPAAAVHVTSRLLRKKLPFSHEHIVRMLDLTAHLERVSTHSLPHLELLIRAVERYVEAHGTSREIEAALAGVYHALEWISNAPERKLGMRIEALCGGPAALPVEPGEAWTDMVLADWAERDDRGQRAWAGLLTHCEAAKGSKPSAKWSKAADALLDGVGRDRFRQCVLDWFPLVDKPRTAPASGRAAWLPGVDQLILEPHANVLKGLVWCCGSFDDRDVARTLTALAISAYRKVPGVGPRAVKVGNACVHALGRMPGLDPVGQLALLKVKVRFRTAQKEIEKALNAAAQRAGISRADLEEMGVPAYGLTEVGCLKAPMGDFTAELRVTDTHSTDLRWMRPDGKTQKSVPAAVKAEHAEELKEVQRAAKDIQKMLPAQRDRLDGLFLQQKSWPVEIWRQRYLDHPLLGTLVRRLIWRFTADGEARAAVYHDEQFVDLADRPVRIPDDTRVELWHPLHEPVEQVLGWRNWLEARELQQPFKQAHREVYLLTDAERQTRIYSNRYAAHIVKQHQFNALCAVRGWKNVLKLLVDQEFPPASRELPLWNLRAEFWTDGAGDDYGTDTNETGTFHYLATDQIRFFPASARQALGHAYGRGQVSTDDALPLEEIPPLVFSEIMRDADLFVGVASVGNDPTWADGGPESRYRDYWYGYSFGDLSGTAQMRREVLQRIVPRLKIADRCSFSDKFLVVRGDIRTYRIHLGSGNILMSPADQYLCIVPTSAMHGGHRVFLPFEGDRTLSIILSKALLLAEDTKITDPTIVRQIGTGAS
jgi:hypothetical protein